MEAFAIVGMFFGRGFDEHPILFSIFLLMILGLTALRVKGVKIEI